MVDELSGHVVEVVSQLTNLIGGMHVDTRAPISRSHTRRARGKLLDWTGDAGGKPSTDHDCKNDAYSGDCQRDRTNILLSADEFCARSLHDE